MANFGAVFAAFEKAEAGDVSESIPEYLIPRLIKAHYGFASLAEAGIQSNLTQPLADASKDVLEALEANDPRAVNEAMTRASSVAARIAAGDY